MTAEPALTVTGQPASEALGPEWELWLASAEDAEPIAAVVRAAFAARPPVDPPAPGVRETAGNIAALLAEGTGVTAWVADRLVGVILLTPAGPVEDPWSSAFLQRVSVHPDVQQHGIAGAMVEAVQRLASDRGSTEVRLFVRAEFPGLQQWWRRHGYRVVERRDHGVVLARRVPVRVEVPRAEDMHALGVRLAALLRPGDVVLADGPLGAGKTTLTQGLGEGLGVGDPVISPTFVLSRVHRPTGGRPGLVHVDAYRLGSPEEVDDLDLDSSAEHSVTVVEWGRGRAEQLSDDRLEIEILRTTDADATDRTRPDSRTVVITPVGDRWDGVDLQSLDPQGGER
ncbi:tRNA (adenosine(37)-N6)-threonylcarbamoyltransferase complex ATPase subunit type 1 TsaE [Desertihabitans brevis]|uniref:tRNA threonylcarbamoyladenosine biosynthesis protein TsaE n=2 Tax=Desertihabitans brevis TaxID=2268447 RepID=A0A367YT71_9ACTN|nr:tRNA (adenosine(37)-N6)-threonylcarbamoyltransferase complex ATPase subunit type 1 TsaE [Desertihabitans brevis]